MWRSRFWLCLVVRPTPVIAQIHLRSQCCNRPQPSVRYSGVGSAGWLAMETVAVRHHVEWLQYDRSIHSACCRPQPNGPRTVRRSCQGTECHVLHGCQGYHDCRGCLDSLHCQCFKTPLALVDNCVVMNFAEVWACQFVIHGTGAPASYVPITVESERLVSTASPRNWSPSIFRCRGNARRDADRSSRHVDGRTARMGARIKGHVMQQQ
jgi:hypothetical protein